MVQHLLSRYRCYEKAIQRYADMYKENITTRDGEDPAQLFLAGKMVLFLKGSGCVIK